MGTYTEPDMREESKLSGAFILSLLMTFAGYCVFVFGVISPTWRTEVGYASGLWARCDDSVCHYAFVGFTHHLTIVQSGIIISLLLLTTSVICALLELIMMASRTSTRHVVRTRRTGAAVACLGEILAAMTLGFYGYKTVMVKNRLPNLSSGFAFAGLGIILSLMGNILKAMGSPATWGEQIFCAGPRHRYKENLPPILYALGSPLPGDYCTPAGGTGDHFRKVKESKKVGLISCFSENKEGYTYTSVSSTASSSLGENYRHYEEISFEEMPPPPPDMLGYPIVVYPPVCFNNQSLQINKTAGENSRSYKEELNHGIRRSQMSPVKYLEPRSMPEQHRCCHQFTPNSFHEYRTLQSESGSSLQSQTATRQTRQQRSIIKAAQHDLSRHPAVESREISGRLKSATGPTPYPRDLAPVTRYHSLPVSTNHGRTSSSRNTRCKATCHLHCTDARP